MYQSCLCFKYSNIYISGFLNLDFLIQTFLLKAHPAKALRLIENFILAIIYHSKAFGEKMSHRFLAKYSSFTEEEKLPWDGYEIYLLLLKWTFKCFRELLTGISVLLRYLAITWKIQHSMRPSQITDICKILWDPLQQRTGLFWIPSLWSYLREELVAAFLWVVASLMW